MSRLALCALAFVPIACADASEAALFELREADAPAPDGTAVIPYGERWREPPVVVEELAQDEEIVEGAVWPAQGNAPQIIVGRWLGALDEDDPRGSALCPFEVTSRGFPAISGDGQTIVDVSRGTWSASDGEDEVMVVRWHEVERDLVVDRTTVFDGDDGARNYDEPDAHCKPMWRAARKAAADINARLDAQSWRTLRYVGIRARDEVLPWMQDDEADAQPPAATRPIEVAHYGKQASLRIRGIEVLHRAEVDWLGRNNFPCMMDANIRAVLGDRESGTLAVLVDHETGGCLCYSELELHALRVPDSIFAEAARRPSPQRVADEVVQSSR